MREIKFRAWDKQNNNFFIPCLSEFNDMNDEIENLTYDGRYRLMQFTGLLDKNKKPIYEGDILKTKYTNAQKVIFENGAFMLCLIKNTDNKSYIPIKLLDRMEVIGNIYEEKEC